MAWHRVSTDCNSSCGCKATWSPQISSTATVAGGTSPSQQLQELEWVLFRYLEVLCSSIFGDTDKCGTWPDRCSPLTATVGTGREESWREEVGRQGLTGGQPAYPCSGSSAYAAHCWPLWKNVVRTLDNQQGARQQSAATKTKRRSPCRATERRGLTMSSPSSKRDESLAEVLAKGRQKVSKQRRVVCDAAEGAQGARTGTSRMAAVLYAGCLQVRHREPAAAECDMLNMRTTEYRYTSLWCMHVVDYMSRSVCKVSAMSVGRP